MTLRIPILLAALLPVACSATPTPDDTPATSASDTGFPFAVEPLATFDEPWAADFRPGTTTLFVTEKPGHLKWIDVATGATGEVSGVPEVDYGGQGGFGDIAFLPSTGAGAPVVYLTWVEEGIDDMRGAVLGRATLDCTGDAGCTLTNLEILWQQVKTQGRGHFSHRIAFSPDGHYLFLTSGDRQKGEPAQDFDTNLGKLLRLTLDGKPAPGNPWADMGGRAAEFWTMGHRNLLGIEFAPDGRLWQIEMGPKGGDELNLIEAGGNYGWPNVSMGSEYSGIPITDHAPGDPYVAPKAWWVPSISPGSFLVYDGDLFEGWKGDALLAGLSGETIAHVDLDGDRVVAKTRYDMGHRMREIVEGPDGALYALEDGEGGRLLKLTPKT